MRYRKPGALSRLPAQAVPFTPQSSYVSPINPYMPAEFSEGTNMAPLPGFEAAPPKVTYKKPAPKAAAPKAAAPAPTTAAAPKAAAPAENPGGDFGDYMFMMSSMMPGAMDPEEMKQMRERLQRLSDQSISRQRNLLDKMNQRYEDSKRGGGGLMDVDWTPMLSLVDMMNRPFTPTNFAQTYQQSSLRPESQRQKELRLSQMERDMLAGERGILNTQIQGMNAMGTGSGASMLREMMKNMRQDKAQKNYFDRLDERERKSDRKYSLKEAGEYATKIMDSVFKDSRDIENVAMGLEDGSLMRVQSVLSSISRMQGERGVLTEGDIGRQLFQSLQLYIGKGGKVEQWFKANPDKPLPPKLLKPLKQTINAAMDASRNSFKGRMRSQMNMMKANPLYASQINEIIPMFEGQIKTIDNVYSRKVPYETKQKSQKAETPEGKALLEALKQNNSQLQEMEKRRNKELGK